ncbi:ABC transporter substrate-binding protein [Paenibacillus cremeus]|uniref:Extracellular solute-binding protein n=1 Tax=Paenibacillus cremeus TaxID=2163881 RepID=A0A559KBE9_9BACL|nr:extracellular solute-binding protein [Paenibacillus cremeus]TVY09457.1 extracellular solute-binding protein [Paenibacillus cremeus]
MVCNRKLGLFVSLLAVSVSVAGCGGGGTPAANAPAGSAPSPAAKSTEPAATAAPAPTTPAAPVTLKVFNWGGLDDNLFQKLVVEPTKKKYPHISFQVTNRDKNTKAEGLAASGADIDILFIQSGPVMGQFKSVKLLEDMTPYIKKNNVNLDRFEPEFMDAIRKESDNGLLGLPFGASLWATFYNKDIFDRFGVPYPKDGMTWDEVYELAKKLTKNEGGVQYKGLDFQTLHSLASPLQLVTVDPTTMKAAVNSPGWANIFDLAKRISDIPGNDLPIVTAAKTRERFLKDKNVAIFASPDVFAFANESQAVKDLNWDIVQYPSFKEKPNVYGMINPNPVVSLGTTGKNKEEAMKVIDLVTSDEVQLAYARVGGKSSLKNPEMKKQFAADLAHLKGKNVAGIFKSKPAPYVVATEFTDNAQNYLSTKYEDLKKGKDVNTFMREAEEGINKLIQSSGK